MGEIRARSGDTRLDQLIDAYEASGYWCEVDANGDEIGLRGKLETLRVPEWADGQCCEVARHFAAYVRADGLGAEEVDGQAWQLYPELDDTLSYPHTWTEVSTASGVFAVDWTASQFDRAEFPAVVRRA